MSRRRRWVRAVAGLATASLVGSAFAVVTESGENATSPPGLDLDGVGLLSNGCSSVLLSGGGWLLGSAHCAAGAGATVTFADGITASIVDVVFAPDWLPAQQTAVNDLSLMKLASPPTGVTGFAISASDHLGAQIVLAGYGAGGSGRTGPVLPAGTLRYGFNDYEFRLPDSAGATYGGKVLGFDFDDGSAALNRFGSLGGGAGEAMLASFDSGGPSFVLDHGTWKIGGIHTGIDPDLGSTFGGVGFDIQPGRYAAWIQQVTAVPEPALRRVLPAGIVLAILWGGVVRRTGHRSSSPTP